VNSGVIMTERFLTLGLCQFYKTFLHNLHYNLHISYSFDYDHADNGTNKAFNIGHFCQYYKTFLA
jgi:hypothetical protein